MHRKRLPSPRIGCLHAWGFEEGTAALVWKAPTATHSGPSSGPSQSNFDFEVWGCLRCPNCLHLGRHACLKIIKESRYWLQKHRSSTLFLSISARPCPASNGFCATSGAGTPRSVPTPRSARRQAWKHHSVPYLPLAPTTTPSPHHLRFGGPHSDPAKHGLETLALGQPTAPQMRIQQPNGAGTAQGLRLGYYRARDRPLRQTPAPPPSPPLCAHPQTYWMARDQALQR